MKGNNLRWSLQCLVLLTVASAAIAQAGEQGVAKRPLGERFPTYDAPDAPGTLEQPVGELRLRDALALALMHNPRLATYSWDVRATEAARLQAGAWTNPEVGFEYENFAGTGVFAGSDDAEATLALSQLVLLGGKRGKRTEVARLDNRLASWDYETIRIQTYAATLGAFVEVLATQEQLALAERIVEVARSIQQAVSARVRAGGTLALEENRARVAVEVSLIEKTLAERRLTIARRELAAMWGSSMPRFARAVGALEGVDDRMPPLDSLLARVNQNPEVARWTSELERRRARVRLIKADRVPDMNITAGIRHHNAVDDVAFVLSLSAPLPTWDRKKGAIREAEYLTEQTGHAREAVATDIRRDIAVAYELLAGAYEEVTRLRGRVLPEAEEAANKSSDAYRAGAIQLTDVLDIQRTFFRLRVRYVNALARYHSAVAELEGLMGAPLAGEVLLGEPTGGREGQ
jgi:cobalt-zinc-cadmium efflux system outer membrane protein